jgi:HNH endonuclease
MSVEEHGVFVFHLHFLGGGYAYYSVYTGFDKFAEKHREIRSADLAIEKLYREALSLLDQRPVLLQDASDYDYWLLHGGWAFAVRDFARRHMRQWLGARTCILGASQVYLDVDLASPSALSRRVPKGRRKAILERDAHRCLLCGRTDLPITLHHVRAYSVGGETTARNLVSLCEPCNQKQGRNFNPNFYKTPLGDLSLLGPKPKEGWYRRLAEVSSDLMLTRCEVF